MARKRSSGASSATTAPGRKADLQPSDFRLAALSGRRRRRQLGSEDVKGSRTPAPAVKFRLHAAIGSKRTTEGRTNRRSGEAFWIHPSGETDLARHDDGIALILIAESLKQVIKLAIHLGNPGLMAAGKNSR